MVWLAALEPAEQMEVNLPPPRRSLVPEATGPSKLHHVVKHTDAERRYEHLLNVGLGTLFKVQRCSKYSKRISSCSARRVAKAKVLPEPPGVLTTWRRSPLHLDL